MRLKKYQNMKTVSQIKLKIIMTSNKNTKK